MIDGQLVDLIRETERQRLRALVMPDVDVAGSLHAADYELITPGGATLTKEAYIGGIASGDLDYRAFEPMSPMEVLLLGEGAAVRYQVHIDIIFAGQHDADRFWHTDIYVFRDARWQVVWSQATRIR